MKEVTYSFSTLRYVHDASAGESLNVGVVLYAPDLQFLRVKYDGRFSRLSEAFAGFDSSTYRKVLLRFEFDIQKLCAPSAGLFQASDRHSLRELLKEVWPDDHLSFQFGPVMTGVASDPAAEVESLFERMVTSRYRRDSRQRVTDDDVWLTYSRPLTTKRVTKALHPRIFRSESFELEFDHAFKNGAWQALKPMSMDYVEASTLQETAAKWLGFISALKGNSELDHVYFLLGSPKDEHRAAFTKAKNILHSVPIDYDLVEENEAESFASHLADYLEREGVLETA